MRGPNQRGHFHMVTPCVTNSTVPPPGSWHPPQSLGVFSGSQPEEAFQEVGFHSRVTQALEPAMFPVSRGSMRGQPHSPKPPVWSFLSCHTQNGWDLHSCGRPRVGCPASERAAGTWWPANSRQVSLAYSKAPEKLLDPRGMWLRTGLWEPHSPGLGQ